MNDVTVEYLADSAVDDAMDGELRGLLTTCFKKPQDVVFQEHRHFKEPPAHRWFIRGESGELIAHTAVHDKMVVADGTEYRIGGVAEVCVHPDYRGRGFVKVLLLVIHEWLTQAGRPFAVLFGNPKVYSSSGYILRKNVVHDGEVDGRKARVAVTPMVRELSDSPWPSGEVYLPGPKF